jgi:hypothetical protein
VEVVDAPLERDCELDEVLAAAADQDALRVPEKPHPHPRHPGKGHPGDADRDGDGGDNRGDVARDVHAYGSEKMTG